MSKSRITLILAVLTFLCVIIGSANEEVTTRECSCGGIIKITTTYVGYSCGCNRYIKTKEICNHTDEYDADTGCKYAFYNTDYSVNEHANGVVTYGSCERCTFNKGIKYTQYNCGLIKTEFVPHECNVYINVVKKD